MCSTHFIQIKISSPPCHNRTSAPTHNNCIRMKGGSFCFLGLLSAPLRKVAPALVLPVSLQEHGISTLPLQLHPTCRHLMVLNQTISPPPLLDSYPVLILPFFHHVDIVCLCSRRGICIGAWIAGHR